MGSKGSKNHNHNYRHGEHIVTEDKPYTTSATQAGIISGASSIPGMSTQIPSGQISTHVNTTSTTMPGTTTMIGTTIMPGTTTSMSGTISQMPDIIPSTNIEYNETTSERFPGTTISGQAINPNTYR
jgi:hypothetical protein